MRKLTLLSPVNARPSKRVSVSRLICSETNEAINRSQCRFRKCPLSNQLIPLPLNDDTAVSGGNGVSVSESEMSTVLSVLDVAPKEMVVWLQINRKNCPESPFLSTKKIGKNSTAVFSIYICSTPNQNHPTPLRTDMFQVMGNTPAAEVI